MMSYKTKRLKRYGNIYNLVWYHARFFIYETQQYLDSNRDTFGVSGLHLSIKI